MNAVVCVPLKRKGVTKVMLLDYKDWYRLRKYKWHVTDSGYAIRNKLNFETSKIRMIRAHKEILNTDKKLDIDHINGNKLDNRKANLRFCTRSQNLHNKRIRNDNTSGYKGVTRDRTVKEGNRCWIAQLNINNKRVYRESFKTKEEAANAYDRAAIKYIGEFARLNRG